MFQGLTLIAENIGSSGEPVESKAHLACDLLSSGTHWQPSSNMITTINNHRSLCHLS